MKVYGRCTAGLRQAGLRSSMSDCYVEDLGICNAGSGIKAYRTWGLDVYVGFWLGV